MTTASLVSPASSSAGRAPAASARYSAWQAAGLQIAPGVPALVAYLVFARFLSPQGLPAIFALYLAILLAEVPATWALMMALGRRESGRVSPATLFPWRNRLPGWKLAAFGLPLALLSLVLMAVLQAIVAEPLRAALFGWVPRWAVMDMSAGLAGLSPGALLALWGLGLVSATLVGGVTQELYARGFLLPRTAHLGPGAPLLNAAAFAVLHLASPWSWPVFFLVSLPWAVAVYRSRSIQLGLVGHVGMLFVMWLGLTMMVWGGAQP